MELLVSAEPPEDFARWLDNEARDSVEPTSDGELAGREVFLGSCSYCHTVRGTNATSDFGPDLTHLASRRTIAAGLPPNTVGDLAAWLHDPPRPNPGHQIQALPTEHHQPPHLTPTPRPLELGSDDHST